MPGGPYAPSAPVLAGACSPLAWPCVASTSGVRRLLWRLFSPRSMDLPTQAAARAGRQLVRLRDRGYGHRRWPRRQRRASSRPTPTPTPTPTPNPNPTPGTSSRPTRTSASASTSRVRYWPPTQLLTHRPLTDCSRDPLAGGVTCLSHSLTYVRADLLTYFTASPDRPAAVTPRGVCPHPRRAARPARHARRVARRAASYLLLTTHLLPTY